MKPTDVYLLLGGNLGKVSSTFDLALNEISLLGELKLQSSLYESPPWGMQSAYSFLNQLIVLNTIIEPLNLLEQLLQIEEQFGRRRSIEEAGYSDRTLDIDILFYGDEVIEHPRLVVPHPRIQDRKFALLPMHELSPNYMHPVFKSSMQTLLDNTTDKTEVVRL